MAEEIKEVTNEQIEVEPVKEDAVAVALGQHNDIIKMKDAAEEKVANARVHLCETLSITAEKYLTANGVMAALDTLRQVLGNDDDTDFAVQLEIATEVAKAMSQATLTMMERADTIDVEDFDKLCEEFYTADFTTELPNAQTMTQELMLLQLCQNVGPSAQDILDFRSSSEEEIMKATDKLAKYLEEHELKAEDIF